MAQKPLISAYRTHGGTGWAACDAEGKSRPVGPAEGAQIETDRKARNAKAGKAETKEFGE